MGPESTPAPDPFDEAGQQLPQWGFETVELDAEQASAAMSAGEAQAQSAYLLFLAGDSVGRVVKIEGEVVIGRGADTDLKVLTPGVSRKHVSIAKEPGQPPVLRDLGSRNGTYVNGKRVESVALRDGDRIMVGDTVILKFSYADDQDFQFQRDLYDSAIRDPLTGLCNRRHFNERLEAEFSFAKRHGTRLALAMVDVDHFKAINDRFGHLVGDAVLRNLGALLKRESRAEDLAARYGGEEFVLVFRGLTEEQGCQAVARLNALVRAETLAPTQPTLRVTVSGGVAALPPLNASTGEELVDAADKALYHSKSSGRDQVTGHSSLGQ